MKTDTTTLLLTLSMQFLAGGRIIIPKVIIIKTLKVHIQVNVILDFIHSTPLLLRSFKNVFH